MNVNNLPKLHKIAIGRTRADSGSASESIPGLDAEIRFEDTHSGYQISQDRSMVKKLKAVYRRMSLPWEPQDFRSYSDGNVLWAAGADPIILGPGRLETAHTPQESVPFYQVIQAAQPYLNLALSL